LADYSSQIEKSISIRGSWSASEEGMALGSMGDQVCGASSLSGVIKLEAKGDHSTIATTTSAFRKAYAVVTFGPIFKFEASSTFAALAAKNPAGPALATLPDIALLPGAVAIKVGDEIVAALESARLDGSSRCVAFGGNSITMGLSRSRHC
jgi:hypothetical protein